MLASAVGLVAALSRLSDDGPSGAVVADGTHRAAPAPSAGAQGTRPAAAETSSRAVTATERWMSVLARLDRRRARAYAAADPALLRAVYVPGSAALRRDQRLLARYAARGLRVHRLRMHVAGLRVRRQRPGSVVLGVRDRVAAGTVTGHGRRRHLLVDDLDTRLLTLRRVDRGVWLMSDVRPAPL
jgi:hypothetical protein